MGLHEAAVRHGMSYTNNNDVEKKLADFIGEKILLAAKIYEDGLVVGSHIKFLDCLKSVWKENDGKNGFYVSDPFIQEYFPDVCGKDKPIMFTDSPDDLDGGGQAECVHVFDKYRGIVVLINNIDSSNDAVGFRKNLGFLLSAIRHECDHTFLQSQVLADNDFESRLLYYMDEAEIRAFSRQLSYLYSQAYPGQGFDYRRLVKLIIDSFPSPAHILRQVLQFLAFMNDHNPSHFVTQESKDYVINRILVPGHAIDVKKLKIIYEKYMNYMAYFVNESNIKP